MRIRRTRIHPFERHLWSGLLPWVLVIPLLIAAAPAVWAETLVGNGQAMRDVRTVATFDAIASSGGIALKLRQGTPVSVAVHGDSNLLPLVETVVQGNQSLHLRWRRGVSVRPLTPVVVEVVAPHVQAVASAGSGNIVIDTMKVARLSLSIKGSGDLNAKGLDAEALVIGVAGSGNLRLAGQAARTTIELSGSGDIDAGELRSDDVTIGIAGSGDAVVHASRTLVASIAGSGDVLYSGDPSVQRAIAGSGTVRKR